MAFTSSDDLHHVPARRIWRVGTGVLLVHLGLLWLTQTDLALFAAASDNGSPQVIMASVVSDTSQPAPQSRPDPQTKPHTEVKPQPQHKPLLQQQAVAAEAANSDTAPVAESAPANPAPAASPDKSGTQGVVLPSADAAYLHNPSPVYPRASNRLREQGTVILRVFITVQGTPEKTEVHVSSGYPRLDQAALEAVQRWRFVPGKRHGTPEAMWFNIPVRFVLE